MSIRNIVRQAARVLASRELQKTFDVHTAARILAFQRERLQMQRTQDTVRTVFYEERISEASPKLKKRR